MRLVKVIDNDLSNEEFIKKYYYDRVLIYTREDLPMSLRQVPFNEMRDTIVKNSHFKIIGCADYVLFLDDDGRYICIKDRSAKIQSITRKNIPFWSFITDYVFYKFRSFERFLDRLG